MQAMWLEYELHDTGYPRDTLLISKWTVHLILAQVIAERVMAALVANRLP
jgi:hypothetical protein